MRSQIPRLAALAIGFAALLAAQPAEASHFRYNHIVCTPTGVANQMECDVQQVWRRSFSAAWDNVGDTYSLNFQIQAAPAGTFVSSVNVTMEVTQISLSQDWSASEGSFTFTFPNGNPHFIAFSGCCRIGGPPFTPDGLLNRADGNWLVRALVDPDVGSAMPRSSVPAIFGYPQSSTPGTPVVQPFPVSDPEGDPIRCRISTDAEAGGGSSPTGFSIDPNTCEMSWDNASLTAGLYTVQILIEELDASGAVQQHTPYDFFLRLGATGINNPPVCDLDPDSPLDVMLGDNVNFDVTATDPDAGDVLEIAATSALPAGATVNPALPASGPSPLTVNFDWTADVLGTTFVTFSVSDGSDVDQCTMRINVTEDTGCGMPSFDAPVVDQSTMTVTETINANDPSGLVTIEFKDAAGDPYLIGGTVTDSDGFVQDPADPNKFDWDPGNGPAPTTASFEITATSQQLRYYIVATNGCGTTHISDPVYDMGRLPEKISVHGNYPNPFNPETMIRFELPEALQVSVKVYDIMGREVATLVNGVLDAGSQQVRWDGRDASGQAVSSGMYLYRIDAPGFSEAHRMIMQK